MSPAFDAEDRALLDPADPQPERARLLDHWLQLHSALVFEPERAFALLEEDADPARALARGALSPPHSARALASLRARLAEHRVRVLPLPSPSYPEALRAIADPPLLLFVRGQVEALHGALVGIVGARAASVAGLEIARALGRRLAQAGCVVVSGLARGIDAAAHRGALEAGGPTVAVQACGPESIYPAQHRRLAREIEGQGAVITEFPLGAPPRAPHFPLRNRVISGLCRAVIVVEARERSGSLITARHALDQGRDVLAVPGPIQAATSAGPNRLIRDGAVPIIAVDDVLSDLGIDAPALSQSSPVTAPAPALPKGGRAILSQLARGGLHRDELARRLDHPPEQLDLDLMELQLAQHVARDRDGRFVRLAVAPDPDPPD